MKWFKCISTKSPAMLLASSELGKAGAFEIMEVVNEAIFQMVTELDLKMVSKWASVRRDRAEKLLPFAQNILRETMKIYGKSTDNDKLFGDVSRKSIDSDASNPVIAGKSFPIDKKERLEREERATTTPTPSRVVTGEKAAAAIFFKINRNGDCYSEGEWIRRCLIDDLRSAKRNPEPDIELKDLEFAYPQVIKVTRRWLKHTPAMRMAAFYYVMAHTSAKNELTYAIDILEKNGYERPEFKSYVQAATEAVERNDYEVKFDG